MDLVDQGYRERAARQLQEIVNLVDAAVCAWDSDFNVTFVNDRYRQLFDVDPASIRVGMPMEELLEIIMASGRIGIYRQLENKNPLVKHLRNLSQPEVSQHFSRNGRLYKRLRQPLEDGGGCVVLRDITASVHDPAISTPEIQGLVASILDYHPGGAVLYDTTDRLVACNANFAAIYNASAEELIGLTFKEVLEVGDRNGGGFIGTVEGEDVRLEQPYCRTHKLDKARYTVQSRDGRHYLIQENQLPGGEILTFRTNISDILIRDEAIRRSSESKRQSANSFLGLGFWTMGLPDGKLEWSDEQFRIYGYEPFEIQPSKHVYRSHIHPDDRNKPGVLVRDSYSQKKDDQWIEFRIIRKDGVTRWLSSHRQFFYDEDGSPLRVSGVTQDITVHKRIENELRRSRETLQDAIGSMNSGFRLVGVDGRMIICNQKYRELYPEIADLLVPGTPVTELRKAYQERTGIIYHAGTSSQEEAFARMYPLPRFETLTPSGLWVSISENTTAEGGLVSVATDITSNKRIEKRLAESETRFRAFTEISSDWFWEATYDTAGVLRYTSVSSRFYEFSGLRPEQVEGKEINSLPIIGSMGPDQNSIEETLKRGLPIRNHVVSFLRSDGSRVYQQINAKPVFDNQGNVTGYLGTGKDMTEERAREDEIRKARDQAERANRAKSEFLASMSHELRTPLNAIIGFSEVVLHEVYGPLGNDRYKSYIGDIYSSGTHLLTLINDILDLSKIESGTWSLQFKETSVGDIVSRCMRMFERQAAEHSVSLKVELPEDLPVVIADDRAMLQMLVNLVSNAVKFTPNNGRVTVSASIADAMLTLSVADNGIGIPQEDMQRILEPFEQVEHVMNRTHQGTGLGLSIVKSLAEAHGGSFRIESTVGEGTIATMTLPLEGPKKKPRGNPD
jgi:two-component system cell cycle sensor histidine kinase PleC